MGRLMFVVLLALSLSAASRSARAAPRLRTSLLQQTPVVQSVGSTGDSVSTRTDGAINVRDYGAKGDGLTDDTAAIQAAIAAAQAVNGCAEFPPGTYLINSTIDVASHAAVVLRTSAALGTIIKAGTAMDYMLEFSSANYTGFCLIENLYFDGNNLAETAIYGGRFQHNILRRVTVRKTTVAAIKFRNGWCNDLVECEIGYNDGDGIHAMGGSPNCLNIHRCKIYHNDGWGVLEGSAYGMSFVGNTVEHNKKGGMLLAYQRGGLIAGNEFSSNGEVGSYAGMGIPPGGSAESLPSGCAYKTELMLNGFVTYGTLSANSPSMGLEITGNVFLPSYSQSAIFAVSGTGLNIHGNHVLAASATPLLRVYRNRNHADLTDLSIGTNTMLYPAATILADKGFVDNKTGLDDVHTWSIAGQVRKNYLDTHQDMTHWTDAAAVAGSTLTLSATRYMGMPAYELASSGATSSRYEVGLDIADDYPELDSQLVWFGCWYWWDDDSVESNLQLYCNVDVGAYYYDTDTTTTEPSGWQFKSMMIAVPASARDFRVGVRKLGSSTSPILICNPILTRVGNRYDALTGTLTVNSHIFNHGMIVTNGSASAGYLELYEGGDNGTNRIRMQPPAALDGDYTAKNGTLVLDDGVNWRVMLMFKAGLLVDVATEAPSAPTATWTPDGQ